MATDENTVNVIWAAHPDGARDYRVAWKPEGEGWKAWDNYDWNAYPTGTGHTITGLEADTTYRVRVKARFGDNPPSGWSSVSTVTTPEATEPENDQIARSTHIEVPSGLNITNRRLVGGTVGWTAPSDPATTHVRLNWEVNGSQRERTRLVSNTSSYTISDMKPNTNNSVEVRFGTNSSTFGESRFVTLRTLAIPAPRNLYFITTGYSSYTAQWDSVTDGDILYVKIIETGPGLDSIGTFDGNLYEASEEGLAPNSTCTVEIKFGTSNTDFGPSATRSTTTRRISAPTNLRNTELDHHQVKLEWDSPSDGDSELRPFVQRTTLIGDAPIHSTRLSPGIRTFTDQTADVTQASATATRSASAP